MSIYASWPDIGEHEDGTDRFNPDGTVLTYPGSHVYPRPGTYPGTVGLAHIPGFIWREGLPFERADQDEDYPCAPYLRLDVGEWDAGERRPMVTGTVVLARAAAERLRDEPLLLAGKAHARHLISRSIVIGRPRVRGRIRGPWRCARPGR